MAQASGNPQTQSLIRRSKYLDEAIRGLQQTPQSQFNTAEGTWGNILSNAILGFAGNDVANKAEAAQKADNERLTAAILGTPQTEAASSLGEAKPFDLTPAGFQGRAQNVDNNRLKAIAEMGGPMAALQYQQAQEDRRTSQQERAAKARQPIEVNGQLVDPQTFAVLGDFRTLDDADGPPIRQVGNQIVERQPDGSWKPVYTGSNAEETARAFQGFIDAATGEQMVVMSNGVARGTGRKAYIAPQITSVGGVPNAVDKRTFEATPLVPLTEATGNKAAMASAEVQGKAQGQAAFDLPAIELRSNTAIASINDLANRNLGSRFGLQSKLYAVPGTEGADVQALINQVTSQAFLNAFDQLRGAGAITEREGQAATQAITRLQNQNISINEAMIAMGELQSYYRKGVEVARQRAAQAPILPQMPAAPRGVEQFAQPAAQPVQPQQSWLARQGAGMVQMGGGQPAPAQADQPPAGIDPEDWKFMDDSQKALFR